MSAPDSNLAETKALLLGLVAEANDLKRTAGGSITDAVAGWLAPQYLLAAREKLTATEGAGRFEVLRTFVQDWAVLRHGDHTAERLLIERERLKLAKRDIKQKWQTKIEAALGALAQDVNRNPAASAACDQMCEALDLESEPKREKEFQKWLQRPEIRKEVFSELTRGLSLETLEKVEMELHLP